MPQLKVQNFYSTALTSDIVGTGDTSFTVTIAPTYTSGFLVISPNNASLREIVYFHNVVGNTVSVRAENRGQGGTTARAHTNSEPVAMKDIAEIFNMFSDSISQCFFVEKTGGLTVKVWGGTVFYNGNPVTVADTSLTLADNQTNYIKYSYPTNTISVDAVNSGNIKARVTTIAGAITSIQYYVAKESYIDFTVTITGALPSQIGQAGKALITNGSTVSWGTPSLPRSIGTNKGLDVDRSTGSELYRDVVDVTTLNDTDIMRVRNTSNQYEDISFANVRTLFSDTSIEFAGETISAQDVLGNEYMRAGVTQFLRFGELTSNQKRGFIFTYSGITGDVRFFMGRSTAFTENINVKFYANNAGVPGTLIDTKVVSSATLNAQGTADTTGLVSVTPNLSSKIAGDEIFVEVERTGSLNSTNFFYLGANNTFTSVYYRHYFYNGTVWSGATFNPIPVFGDSVIQNMAVKYNSTITARSLGLGVASSGGIIGQGISCVKRGLATITGIKNGQAYKTLGNGTLTPVTTTDVVIATGYATDKLLVPFSVAKYIPFVNTSISTLVIPVKAGDTVMVYGYHTAGGGGGVTNTTVTGPGISLSWAPGYSTYDFNGAGVANADGSITIQQGSFPGSTIVVNSLVFLKK